MSDQLVCAEQHTNGLLSPLSLVLLESFFRSFTLHVELGYTLVHETTQFEIAFKLNNLGRHSRLSRCHNLIILFMLIRGSTLTTTTILVHGFHPFSVSTWHIMCYASSGAQCWIDIGVITSTNSAICPVRNHNNLSLKMIFQGRDHTFWMLCQSFDRH